RVPDRAPLGAPPAALAARGHRVRRLHPAAAARRAAPHPRPTAARRDVRALPAPRVPRREAILDRGARRDGAHAGRDDHAGCTGRHRRGGPGHGAPRAPECARARSAAQLRVDHGRVRGPARRRRDREPARRRRRRCEVPPRRALVALDRRGCPRGRGGTRRAAPHRPLALAEPVAPRVRQPRRRRPPPRTADRGRARHTPQEPPAAPADTSRAISITIHGDAAFPGQGVVAETLNLQSLAGYRVGGPLHVIANNQVGFTTDPHDARSTRYSSDLAKGFVIPIIHVNADAVDACRSAVRLEMAFRERFGRDVLIDLVGYRRFGHNETDEPSYTQPLQVERIKAHPSVVTLYARRLIDDGLTDETTFEARRAQMLAQLADAHHPSQADGRAEREPAERMARDLDQV